MKWKFNPPSAPHYGGAWERLVRSFKHVFYAVLGKRLLTGKTTRAVHFEVVPSMDTSSCVMGIERFAARRDTPSVLWSDNGTNFIASDKELLQNVRSWKQQFLAESLVKKGMKWKFNPPSAPHYGGAWERLVRSFKHVFYAVLGKRLLTDEILATTFCLVEQSLNAQPLVPASADATNLDALTPNHFLLGTSGSILPSHQQADVDHRKRSLRSSASLFWHNMEQVVKRIRSHSEPPFEVVIAFKQRS